jgi:hypothetical protein
MIRTHASMLGVDHFHQNGEAPAPKCEGVCAVCSSMHDRRQAARRMPSSLRLNAAAEPFPQRASRRLSQIRYMALAA